MSKDEKIDFVITWVDGSDTNWISEKNKYSHNSKNNNQDNRYRDFDTLKYLIRGIEKFAPWVNKIYLVTYGHLPKWLDTTNKKLKIINHSDIINHKYLPTFNSCAIEMNLHKIKGLNEKFVYFNDDILILKKVTPEDFFHNGLPRDIFCEDALISNGKDDNFSNILTNCSGILNKKFNKRWLLKNYFFKYFNIKYGLLNIRTLLLLPWPFYSSIYNHHLSFSYLKSTFEEVWKDNYDICNITSKSKFRTNENVSQYVFRYYQIASGKFYPRKRNFGKYYDLTCDNSKIISDIVKQKHKIICVNDSNLDIDFEKTKEELIISLDKILGEQCSFEKKVSKKSMF